MVQWQTKSFVAARKHQHINADRHFSQEEVTPLRIMALRSISFARWFNSIIKASDGGVKSNPGFSRTALRCHISKVSATNSISLGQAMSEVIVDLQNAVCKYGHNSILCQPLYMPIIVKTCFGRMCLFSKHSDQGSNQYQLLKY